MKVNIIADSSANINNDIREQLTILPLTVRFGNTEYIDGVTINNKQFYEMLIESDEMPTTSQAVPSDFIKIFDDIKAKGESAVVITISSTLSGTYQSACLAAKDYDNVYIVDSLTASIGSGVLVEYAIQLVQKGYSAEEIAKKLNNERKNICLIALLDTLEYLKRGGRISKTAAFAGSLLNIKPVIAIKDGELTVLGKARGSKQGNNLLITEIQKSGGIDFSKPVLLGYTGLDDTLLQKYITDSEMLWKENVSSLNISQVGSVIGTHAGPGAIAAAFFKNTTENGD